MQNVLLLLHIVVLDLVAKMMNVKGKLTNLFSDDPHDKTISSAQPP